MSSTPQIEANRANSQLSTGPRTPEGKAASSSNSTKLGFYAKQAVLLTPEDHADFQALDSAYAYELRPYSPVERTLFRQVASPPGTSNAPIASKPNSPQTAPNEISTNASRSYVLRKPPGQRRNQIRKTNPITWSTQTAPMSES